MENIRRASVKQLAHKIKGFGKHPRFAFFLGAGASRQSGIITAGEMVRFFKDRILDECCSEQPKTDEEKEKWLRAQEWYTKNGSEYCKLFEQFEPKEIGRQRYIESIIEGQEPSYGYVVLANLLASNYINTIITTNFDDLVYSACTSYTGIRPIVYAYGVLASEMRITAQRPKILKLHGDFLYSTLKNTDSELAMQDPNMARQLTQVLSEYGLVVAGYSGGDKSVMDILSRISDKNDLYWCIRRGEEPNEAVKKLLNEKGGFIVEIEGFDEMMNEVRQIVGFDVSNMFGSIQDRQDQMIEKLKDFAPRYSIDILSEIVAALQNQAKESVREQKRIKEIQSLDFFTKGLKAQDAEDFHSAEDLYRKAIELNPRDSGSYNNLGVVLFNDATRKGDAEAMYRKAIELDPNNAKANNNLAFFLKELERLPEAEEAYRKAIEIDPNYINAYNNLITLLRLQGRGNETLQLTEKCLQLDPLNINALFSLAYTHKRLEQVTESTHYTTQLRGVIKPDDWYNLACLESICGNTDTAIENLRRATQSDSFNRDWAKRDPDLEWIREDQRFKEIVGQDTV